LAERLWFADDALAHALDAPSFCPRCGAGLSGRDDGGLVVEYWTADERVFHCWCRSCHWSGDIRHVGRMIGHEAE
jgi:hypothetical protein